MYCPKCKQPGKGRFCRACGGGLVAGEVPAADTSTQEATAGQLVNPSFVTLGVCECGAGPDKVLADGTCSSCKRQRIPECSVCSAPASGGISDTGVCLTCSAQRLRKIGDHDEIRLSATLASVCDRGIKHLINQDWHGLAQVKVGNDDVQIIVVCDGVSSSSASQAAAKAAVAAAVERASFTLTRNMSARDSIIEAARAAQKAVCSVLWTPQPMFAGRDDESPTCTFVMAVVRNGVVDYGWLGDSRIYWVTADGAGCLVKDHSYINLEIAKGRDPFEVEKEAKENRLTRAIVRSLGSSESADVSKLVPELAQFTLPKGGVLVVCSDGLHVYLDGAQAMAERVRAKPGADALAIAKSLVDTANSMGGCDNVTAAILCN